MLAFIFLLFSLIYPCAKPTAAVIEPVPPKVRTALAY